MEFTRNIRKGTSGEDVLLCKQKLLELGYYADHITTVTKKTFGADTLEAVERFQAQAGLTVDGVIGIENVGGVVRRHGGRSGDDRKGNAVGESACDCCARTDPDRRSVCMGRQRHDGSLRQRDPGEGRRVRPGDHVPGQAVQIWVFRPSWT